MRISDWSSDVCSSDLPARHELVVDVVEDGECKRLQRVFRLTGRHREIGRESGRREQAFVGHIGYLDLDRACLTRKEGQIVEPGRRCFRRRQQRPPCKMLRDHTRSEEHTSEIQSLMRISYAV